MKLEIVILCLILKKDNLVRPDLKDELIRKWKRIILNYSSNYRNETPIDKNNGWNNLQGIQYKIFNDYISDDFEKKILLELQNSGINLPTPNKPDNCIIVYFDPTYDYDNEEIDFADDMYKYYFENTIDEMEFKILFDNGAFQITHDTRKVVKTFWSSGNFILDMDTPENEKILKSEAIYSQGKIIGPMINYNKNGSLKSKIYYKNNIKEFEEVYKDDCICRKNYYNNMQMITKTQYFENGFLTSEDFYEENIWDDILEEYTTIGVNHKFKSYYENGNICIEGYIKKDLRHGIFKLFNEKGNLSREYLYENGKQIYEKKFDEI